MTERDAGGESRADRPFAESTDRANELAVRLCRGFQHHDQRNHAAAIDAFSFVDEHWFPHLAGEEAERSAEDYVDALWAKDALERQHGDDGEIDPARLSEADWSEVQQSFRARAERTIEPVIGTPGAERYAASITRAWKHHKIEEDYWTPMQVAQLQQVRAALHDPSYPEKPSDGRAGPGPEPAYYTLGVELHDMHSERRWEEAVDIMTLYFDSILRKQ